MRSDAMLAFVPIGSPLSLISGANVPVPSPGIIDLMGSGVGTAPPNIIGSATVFGQDPGVGAFRPEINVIVGTALVGSTSINTALQYAVDSGAAGGYLPGTWNTVAETGAIAIANLTANQVIARFPFLPAFPPGTLPRYLRLLFTPVGTTTAGTILSAIVTLVRDDQANRYAAKNYAVA